VSANAFLASIYDLLLWPAERSWLTESRRALLRHAHGRVLEIGAGDGRNLPHYVDVDALEIVEPDRFMRAKMAERARLAGIEVVDAKAEALPFEDASFDTVVSTLVLCSVRDPGRALAEIHRVLKPGGKLLFLEHVRGEGKRARMQERLDPLWSRAMGGCHLDRASVDAIARAELSVDAVERFEPKWMPSFVGPIAVGIARR
jgi:SAM-dependent methyltransferase